MSGLFRCAVVLACASACSVGAAEVEPETEPPVLTSLAERYPSETAPHRRALLPPALMPTRRPPASAVRSPDPQPAVETLRIERCDPVDPPPRL